MAVATYNVYQPVIQSMFGPIGTLGRYNRNLALRIVERAKREAPRRSGALAASHGVLQGRSFGRFTSEYQVWANMPYARWVHEGTIRDGTAWIKSTRGFTVIRSGPHEGQEMPAMMGPLPAWNGHPAGYRIAVRGQEGNDWLERAAFRVVYG